MDEREKMRSWIDKLVQLSTEKGSVGITQDIDLLLTGVSRLSGELARATQAQATQEPKSQAKPAKSAPKKAPQRRPQAQRSTHTPKPQKATQTRSLERPDTRANTPQRTKPKELPLSLQKQQLRHEIYGRDTQDKKLRQAAKALTS